MVVVLGVITKMVVMMVVEMMMLAMEMMVVMVMEMVVAVMEGRRRDVEGFPRRAVQEPVHTVPLRDPRGSLTESEWCGDEWTEPNFSRVA